MYKGPNSTLSINLSVLQVGVVLKLKGVTGNTLYLNFVKKFFRIHLRHVKHFNGV